MKARQGCLEITTAAVLLLVAGLVGVAQADTPGGPSSPLMARSLADQRNDYGISLALKGQVARAESAFVAMLSTPVADARAFNNIGNMHFLRGELDVALAFYDRAGRADTLDAGIQLNRATTLMMLGSELSARIAAARGVRLAGGEAAAARLLGLKVEDVKPKALAAEGAWVSKDEVRALLASAAQAVPPETTRALAAAGKGAGGTATRPAAGGVKATTVRGKTVIQRSAGPRGAEGTDAAAVLYWMR